MKNLASIPAHSGSQELMDKNIKNQHGLQLCAYTINAARESGVFEEIQFSTDFPIYANIAMQYAILASDTASSRNAAKKLTENYKINDQESDAVMLLQPTVPFRNAENICNPATLSQDNNARAVVSVTVPPHSPLRSDSLPPDGNIKFFNERFEFLKERQTLDKYYVLNGAVYPTAVEHWLNSSDICKKGCYACCMPRERSFDIDSQPDFYWGEFYHRIN